MESEEMIEEIRNCVRLDVAGGFLEEDEIIEGVIDYLCDDYEENELRPIAERVTRETLTEHLKEQETWPASTDCDRLDEAFEALEISGIVARQHFSCCGTCGTAEIGTEMEEAQQSGANVRGYTFYHYQDTERAVDGDGLYLNYGAVAENEQTALGIAQEIVGELQAHGLQTTWEGSLSRRIWVSLEWKKRR